MASDILPSSVFLRSMFLVLVSITEIVRFLFCNSQDVQYRKLGLIICILKIFLLWQPVSPSSAPVFPGARLLSWVQEQHRHLQSPAQNENIETLI